VRKNSQPPECYSLWCLNGWLLPCPAAFWHAYEYVLAAMTRHSEIFFIAAIHFHARSEAAIAQRGTDFQPGRQVCKRFELFKSPKALGFERQFTESNCRSNGWDFIQIVGHARSSERQQPESNQRSDGWKLTMMATSARQSTVSQ
jgi:hypothetical protein